jgi:hypothetical protein
MVQESNSIELTPLAIELNFQKLKDRAMDYIKQYSSVSWTNYNPSDPGITILEQICFALTELGYCGDFPMADILTQKNNQLQIDQQFYQAQNIFTTAPITVEDYKKFLIDQVQNIHNAYIKPIPSKFSFSMGVYKVFIHIENNDGASHEKGKEKGETTADGLLDTINFRLNAARNLGEYFLEPSHLKVLKHTLEGTVIVAASSNFQQIYHEIKEAIQNYIFPNIPQVGYQTLTSQGESTDQIYEGPTLQNGYVPQGAMLNKRNTITTYELTNIIQSVSGVLNVDVKFTQKPSKDGADDKKKHHKNNANKVSSKSREIIVIDISSITFQIRGDSKPVNITKKMKEATARKSANAQINEVSTVSVAPPLPQGNYREISEYYSIQNTFPEAYKVGPNAIDSNSTNYQTAQSRQLKGYLTLFDQVIANQFAQLSNLGNLFSFQNSITGTPKDLGQYKANMTEFEKLHQRYPVPFKSFSPTYFYQSLYESVPEIRHLLKNFEAYSFTYTAGQDSKELDKTSWKKYKNSPYNSYIWGLMYFMEKEDVNLTRRNNILNHLLARHGESPMFIDDIVNIPIYSTSVLKDRVIVKSLYLQNLQVLSYNRIKAYNFLGCENLATVDKMNPVYHWLYVFLLKYKDSNSTNAKDYQQKLQDESKRVADSKSKAKQLFQAYLNWDRIDLLFNIEQIDTREQVTQEDATNFSGLELKLNLLFSLNQQYQKQLLASPSLELIWMRYLRKGLLLIETNLLLTSAIFTDGKKQSMNYSRFVHKKNQKNLDAIQVKWSTNLTCLKNPLFKPALILIFPEFCGEIDGFKQKLACFLKSELPPSLVKYNPNSLANKDPLKCLTGLHILFLDSKHLPDVIKKYVAWHNTLLKQHHQLEGNLSDSAGNLASCLSSLINSSNSKKNTDE